jgi:hypothetical protein
MTCSMTCRKPRALRYARDMLVSSGVLPARNEHLERLAPWLEHLLHEKPAHHARLIRPFAHWFVLRRARRAAARRTFTRGSADFARARILAALDLLSWLDQRGQDLCDLTQADLDRWLTDGTTTRRAARYFLHWAHGRGLVSDLNVPLPPRQEPERLLGEDDHIHQLDRCLTDEAMPLDLRVGGALVLLFGMLVSRITQLTKDDVIEDSQATWLPSTVIASCCPPGWPTSSASSATRTSSGGHSAAWEPGRHGSSLARARHVRPWTSSSASVSASTA